MGLYSGSSERGWPICGKRITPSDESGYNNLNREHAVADAGASHYTYDANGNMISRPVNGSIATLNYDAETRLVKVCQDIDQNGLCGSGDTQLASFVYDADGNRVQSTIGAATTTFVGNYYETDGTTVTKYYYVGAQRIAMRKDGTLNFLLSDQLGSTTVTTDDQGEEPSTLRYKPWGEVRMPTSGLNPGPSDYTYTGQYSNVDDLGLMFYNARWYDPALGRFAQADSIVPQQSQGVQAWDRYAYASNNPSSVTDPSGHKPCWATTHYSCHLTQDIVDKEYRKYSDKDKAAVAAFFASQGWQVSEPNQHGLGGMLARKSSGYDEVTLTADAPWTAKPLFDIASQSDGLPHFACEWIDCALSVTSTIASVGTLIPIPAIAGGAFVVDIVVTVVAVVRTENAYSQGRITNVNRWALNISGVAGLIPGGEGVGFSVMNTLITFSGYPH